MLYPFCVGQLEFGCNFARKLLSKLMTMTNNTNLFAVTFRKKWIERLENMGANLKFKCLMAAYEYIVNRRYTCDAERDREVREFLWYVIDDMKVIARRREAARRRREERKRIEAERRAIENDELTANQCFIADTQDYRRNPALYMFDGFMYYLMSPMGKSVRPDIPTGRSLGELLMKFRKWAIETSRVADISKLNVFRDVFVRNLTRFA